MGGGNTALQDALFLSNTCSSVTVIHRRNEFRGDDRLVKQLEKRHNVHYLMSHLVSGLNQTDGEFSGITVRNLQTGKEEQLPVKGLFVAVGQSPQTKAFAALAQTDKAGYLVAGENCESSTPGIFIAGDCRTKEIRQLTTAAADGAVAALAACSYIG